MRHKPCDITNHITEARSIQFFKRIEKIQKEGHKPCGITNKITETHSIQFFKKDLKNQNWDASLKCSDNVSSS